MKPTTTIALLAVAGLAAVGAFLVVKPSPATSSSPDTAPASSTSSSPGKPFLPSLAAKINDVAQIEITRPEFTFTIHKVADTWRVKDKGDYPAKPEIVRSLVIALADLKELEPKTTRPELYSKIGVEDPVAPPPDAKDKATPQSALVTLRDAAGAAIAEVIVGNRKHGQTPSTSGVFIRRKGEAQSWLCQGQLDLQREQLAWIDTQFANIDRARIKSVRLQPREGDPILVSRSSASEPFKIENIPLGKQLKDASTAESIAGLLSFASLMDVAPVGSVSFAPAPNESPASSAQLRTFDGLSITITSITRDAKTWWKLSASADQAAAREHAALPPDPTKPDENRPTPEQIDAAVAKLTKESDDLNAKWSQFAIAPQEFKARPMAQVFAELFKDPDPPAPAPGLAPEIPSAPTATPPLMPQTPR